jgi:transcriptional regulator with XRE-family HTH domain
MDKSTELDKLLDSTPPVKGILESLKANKTDFDKDPEFVTDYLKGQIVEDILSAMKENNISKAVLAQKLGKSKQYIGRILNETTNFTLKTIAEITCALNRKVVISLTKTNEIFIRDDEYSSISSLRSTEIEENIYLTQKKYKFIDPKEYSNEKKYPAA